MSMVGPNYSEARRKLIYAAIADQQSKHLLNEALRATEAADKAYAVQVQALFDMTSSRDFYVTRMHEEQAACRRQAKRIAALQGVITRMKRKLL